MVHFEVGAVDDESLVAFYGGLFGWGLRAGGGYTVVDTRGGGINGGIGKSRTGEPWSAFYVETDDPQATLDAAKALGGTTVMLGRPVRGSVRCGPDFAPPRRSADRASWLQGSSR